MKGPCEIEDCHSPARSRGWCEKHYRRYLRCGDPSGTGKTGRRRGEEASYNAVHLRLKRDRGRASAHRCVDCGLVARTWSYDHSDPDAHVDRKGRPFSTDLARYAPRCDSCHTKLDWSAARIAEQLGVSERSVVRARTRARGAA